MTDRPNTDDTAIEGADFDGTDFDAVLDACIDDLGAGRRTLEQCLAAWPQHREALEAVLGTAEALQRVPRGVERASDPSRRAAFMSQIRTLPQEQPFESTASEPASPAPAARGVDAPSAERGGLAGAFRSARRLLPSLSWGRAGMIAAPAAITALALALVLAVGSSPSTAHAATATVFGGSVEHEVDGRWQPLSDGAAVAEGAHLRTGADGRVVLTFGDGSTAALDPSTDLLVARLQLDGERAIELVQASGRLWNDVAVSSDGASDGGSYVVETPDARVSAQGTLFEVAIRNGATDVSAEGGRVEVVAGAARALLAAGETTTARDHAAVEEAHPLARALDRALELTIEAPFAASLIDPHARATGALPDGVLYRQIAGVVTTNPGDGDQQIAVYRLEDGTYELLLRRVEAGSGEVLIRIGDRVERFPLGALDEAVRLRIVVVTRDGQIEVAPALVGRATQATVDAILERIVITDRVRDRAVPVADQLAARRAASATPTATPTRAVATATVGDAAPTRTATPETTRTATATPEATARPSASATASTTDLTLAQVVERCAAGVLTRNETLEGCSERWPQFADRLGPALRDWFARGVDVPRDGAGFEQALRACAGGVLTGAYTLQDCGRRWPAYTEWLTSEARRVLEAIEAPVVPPVDHVEPSASATPTATRGDASTDSATP